MANKHYKTPQGIIYYVGRTLQEGKYKYELCSKNEPNYLHSEYPRQIKVCESKQKAYELSLTYLEKAYIDFEKKVYKDHRKLDKFEKLLRDMSYNAFQAYAHKIELSDKVLTKGIE